MVLRKLLLLFSFCIVIVHTKNDLTSIFIQNYIDGKIEEFVKKIDQNNQCVKDLIQVINGIKNMELWALRMFDSSSKLNTGYLNGNLVNYGSFDSCLAIDHSINNSSKIKGKYCVYYMNVISVLYMKVKDFELYRYLEYFLKSSADLQPQYIYLKNGSISVIGALCIPDSCRAKDIQKLYDALNFNENILNFTITVNDTNCQTLDDLSYDKWETSAWIGIGFFVFIGFLMLTHTIYHVYIIICDKKPIHDVFLVFSVYANIKKILSIRDDLEMIPCINGLRAISMLWIIIGHRFLLSILDTNTNELYVVEKWAKGPMATVIFAGTYAVDTFFVISGILVIYIVLTAKSKGIQFNLFQYYLHRYIRLTPALGAVIIVFVTFFKHLSYGPMLPMGINLIKPCYKNWWMTILYINNYLQPKDMCVQQSWYLAIDTQLYVLAPIIFIPLQIWPNLTLLGMVILILMSCYDGFYTGWINHMDGNPSFILSKFTNYYASTLVRMHAWLVGAIIGYILFKTRGKEIKINRNIILLTWAIVLLTISFIISHIAFFTNYNAEQIYSSISLGFSRLLWSVSMGWIVWACVHGYSGIINKFLSCKIFTILGRLTYSMYLLQIGMFALFLARKQTPEYFSNFFEIHAFWGDLVFITATALLWCLAFESPVIAIGKLFLSKGKLINVQNQELNRQSRL